MAHEVSDGRAHLDHVDDPGLQLEPFLIIGVISAVLHIPTVGLA